MNTGFYKRRRGVLEHIESGEIDLLEDGIHDFLSLKANLVIGSPSSIPVGVCFTSAPAIHAHCRRVSERTVQRCLEHLEAIGWIKSNPWKVPGKRGNYPVVLCRASVHDLSGNEYRINGEATTDWRDPKYEPVGEVSGNCRQSVASLSGLRKKRVENKKRGEKPRSQKSLAHPSAALLEKQKEQLGKREAKEKREQDEGAARRFAKAGHNLIGEVAAIARAKEVPRLPISECPESVADRVAERRRNKQLNDFDRMKRGAVQ